MSPWLSDALLRSQSDERLVALAREGRERAFTTLVERYRRPLLRFARRLAGEARAEDAVQQALLQAWTALQNGAQVHHTSGWLHQIVRHAAWKAAPRAGDGQPLTGEEPAAGDFESAVEQRLAVQALMSSMAELPERQRQALLQTELEGRSRQEVATSLGLSQGAVRQLVHRARVTLRTAATAITPWPAVAWAARAVGGPGESGPGSRIAEAVAGAGSAGIAGTIFKAGAVVVATGALAAGAVVPHTRSARRVITVKQQVASSAKSRGAAARPRATTTATSGSVAGTAGIRAAQGRASTGRGSSRGGSGSGRGTSARESGSSGTLEDTTSHTSHTGGGGTGDLAPGSGAGAGDDGGGHDGAGTGGDDSTAKALDAGRGAEGEAGEAPAGAPHTSGGPGGSAPSGNEGAPDPSSSGGGPGSEDGGDGGTPQAGDDGGSGSGGGDDPAGEH
jgi:RNA polymerase sigma factor (sigma-70 family)